MNKEGAFKEGLDKIETLLLCPSLTTGDKVALYLFQYKLHRNRLKNKKAQASILGAQALQKAAGISYSLDLQLLLAESYALTQQPQNFERLFPQIEKEIQHYTDSLTLGRFYFLKQFSVDRDRQSAQHINFLYKALEYFKNTTPENIYYKGNLLRSLGNGSRTHGDFDKAISFYSRELEVWREQYPPLHFNVSICHYNLGNVYYEKLEYQKALDHYLIAHPVWTTVFEPESHRMRSLNEAIGDMYWELQNHPKALEYFNYAVLYEEKVNNDTSEITLTVADSLLNKGNYASAINYYEEAVKWRQKTYGENHMLTGACKNFVARALQSAGDMEASLDAYQEAIIILVKGFEDTSWYANPSADMNIQSHQYLLEALIAKGNLLKELYTEHNDVKDLTAAWDTQALAIQLVEKIKNNQMSEGSKVFWSTKTTSLLESAVDTAIQLYHTTGEIDYLEKAFYVSEQSKAFLLLASLYDQEITAFANIPKEIIEKERIIKAEINEYVGRIESEEKRCAAVRQKMLKLYTDKLHTLQNEYDVFINTISQEFPQYYKLKYNVEIPSVQAIQKKLLVTSNALISYFLGAKNSYVFYVTSENISVRVIENTEDLNSQIQTLFALLSTPNENNGDSVFQNYKQTAFQLYQRLLQPEVGAFMPKQLMIIPDGNLAYIPFEALLTESSTETNYARLPYVLQKTAISYAPSASVAMHFYTENGNGLDYYGFAPDYSQEADGEFRKKQANLRFNIPEVEFAASLFNGQSWTGPEVTEELLREYSKKAGILHLAMHGEVEDEHPLLSKLYFNASEKEDGLLNMYEVYNLSIPSQLVILSACKTATGKLQRGEGILSLERAFQYAGSKSLVATLWSVDDAASSKITQDFLKNIKEGQSKDVALQQAKIAFLATANPERLHPFYWSSFKLTGNTHPLQKGNLIYYFVFGGLLLLLGGVWLFRRNIKKNVA
ncbi:CHAT domain-containing protein [Aureisphaera sp. CAU 1614]|uniref:CHAT domain-containing protein n=1 Tax=Halomarinibacterium sedimenti TaxID=2857106 RepID=A0A9X1JW20_9FLAO|nr:CHAT domain-containing tetratricopeptide repeat protein [Halomarinibacterium sedimenti]MBW2936573.1 CHAT domain-containing protein [Halomarinibacterium sedimenti]